MHFHEQNRTSEMIIRFHSHQIEINEPDKEYDENEHPENDKE